MTDQYPNIPSTVLDFTDGNLQPKEVVSSSAVVVVGTASKGVSDVPVKVASRAEAIGIFGTAGTLARSIVEAFDAGATLCYGVRILATSARLDDVGADTVGEGLSIETASKGDTIASYFSVLVDAETRSITVLDAKTGIKLYERVGDIVTIDRGYVTVEGSLDEALITGAKPVSIGLQVKVMDDETLQKVTVPAAVGPVGDPVNVTARKELTLPNTCNLSRLRLSATNGYVAQLGSVGVDGAQDFVLVHESAVTSVDPATFKVVLTTGLPTAAHDKSFAIRFVSKVNASPLASVVTNRIALSAAGPLRYTRGSNGNGLFKVDYNEGLGYDDTQDEAAPGKINLFEALVGLAETLDSVRFNVVHFPGIYLDDAALDGATALPAKLNGDNTTFAASATERSEVVATFGVGQTRDALKLSLSAGGAGGTWLVLKTRSGAVVGSDGEDDEVVRVARVLSWEDVGATLKLHLDRDLSIIADGAVACDLFKTNQLFFYRSKSVDGSIAHFWYSEPVDPDGFLYHEVNFAYQLAYFCAVLSNSERTVTATIGVNPPQNHYNTAAVARWIGRKPVYDYDGNVLTNGNGLLGNKFMAGAVIGGRQFKPGFILTVSGYLDDTDIPVDANGRQIDLGRHLSVVASWGQTSNASDTSRNGYFTSCAAMYAGLTSGLAPWVSATNKKLVDGLAIPVQPSKRHLDDLVGTRYVMVYKEDRTVVSADSAALKTSDFTQNRSIRLAGEAANRLREITDDQRGEAPTPYVKQALKVALESEMNKLKSESNGAIESFELQIADQTDSERTRGAMRITFGMKMINELRKIYVTFGRS